MARTGSRTWPTILGIAGFAILVGWFVSGYWVFGIIGLLLLLAMLGGALMYRFMGPPER